jgi:hypothetical protein
MRFINYTFIALFIIVSMGCGDHFESQSVNDPIQSFNNKMEYTGKFKIKCQIELTSDTERISFFKESSVFNYDNLTSAESQVVVSIPPYNLVAKFVDRTETVLNIDPTYCVNFYNESDSHQIYCEKDGVALGHMLQNGLISLPYLRTALLDEKYNYNETEFKKARAECFLENAK